MNEPRKWTARAALGLAAGLVAMISCGGDDGAGTGGRSLSIAVCDPGAGPFSLEITNPFFPMPVGRQLVLEGVEDGEAIELVITVLSETEAVAGVTTRVLEERETADGEPVEVSRNFFAQAPDGTVCYFGEDVVVFEDGQPVPADDQWRAGENGALPGIIMPADPMVGDRYQQEAAPGVAEDRGRVTARGEPITVPAGTFNDTLTVLEDTPLEPDAPAENNIYASGVGPVRDGPLDLTSFN